ncbi:MAG: hypothetical protein OHK0013_11810 [Sandaracinaceae bacterium]
MTEIASHPMAKRWTEKWATELLSLDGNDLRTARRLVVGLALSWAFGPRAALEPASDTVPRSASGAL